MPIARAALLPQLSASWSKSRSESEGTIFSDELNRDVTFSSTSRNANKGLQLSQSIYDHGSYMSLRAAKAQAARGDSDYDTAADALLVRVAEAYFGVLTAQTNLASAEAEEKAVGRQLEQAEQRFEVGLTAITDVHEARARHDGARAAVILSQNALDDTFEALSELTGDTVASVKGLKEEIPLVRPDPDSLERWSQPRSPATRAWPRCSSRSMPPITPPKRTGLTTCLRSASPAPTTRPLPAATSVRIRRATRAATR